VSKLSKKIFPLRPEGVPDEKPIVMLTVGELEQIVEFAVERALERKKSVKLLFNTREAAAMLNVPESWLAANARAKQVPYRQVGHYRYFSQEDIDEIIASHHVPMVHLNSDG
jgi:hypothetical protein